GTLKTLAPNEATTFPFGSNFWIGLSGELAHVLLPQRSNTQTLLPSLSASTPIAEPILRPAGSCAQFSSNLYGLGAALGSVACARVRSPAIAIAATIATPSVHITRSAVRITVLLGMFELLVL